MSSDKRIARTAGALFLLSMTVSIVYTSVFSAALESPLADISPNRARVVIGALLELVNCFAVVGIAVALHAILKRHHETLALCYVGLRAVECAVLVVGVVAGLSLLTLSDKCIGADGTGTSHLQAVAATILAGKEVTLQMGILICGLGGLILTSMLYRFRLVPRFISAWGLLGYVLVIASVGLSLFGVIDTKDGSGKLMYVPGGLFETLVFPVWLIVRGFTSPPRASGAP